MSNVHVEKSEGILTITWARPEKKNALTVQMYADATAALRDASQDPKVRVVLVTGQGETFTSGNDLRDFMSVPPTGEDSPVFQFLLALLDFDKPIVVAVNGLAIGIGATMLLHSDLVYAADDARFTMPFVPLGIVPEASSSLLLPRMAGHVQASEILLFGEPFDATTAREVGLVTRVVPKGELWTVARERALALVAKPAASVRATKKLMKSPTREAVRAALFAEAQIFGERLGSPEMVEAITAFLEKRKPDFSRFD